MGQLKTANAIGHGAGKRAFAMAKQFTFKQIFGNGRAVDGHKITAAPIGLIVQGSRHNSLPVPLSPVINTVALDEATRSIKWRMASALGLAPMKALEGLFLAMAQLGGEAFLNQVTTVLQFGPLFSINVGKPSGDIAFSQQLDQVWLKLLKLMPNQSLKDFVSAPSSGELMNRVTSLCLILGLTALTGCKSINLSMAPEAESKSLMTPLVEKRETITATGYAVVAVQNHKNPAQQRLMAIRASKLDAYRNLTEQVYGQQLDASSTVADMVVTNDTFRTKVEGVIYGARLVRSHRGRRHLRNHLVFGPRRGSRPACFVHEPIGGEGR